MRDLARQIDSALFERVVLHPPKVSTALRELHPGAEAVFRDAYLVEFLDLPDGHEEADLHKSLLANLRQFLAELGRDLCFVGSEVLRLVSSSRRAPMRYAVVVEKARANFSAYVPDLPGCVAAAETEQEVLDLIREAIDFHLEGMREAGEEIPEPTSVTA